MDTGQVGFKKAGRGKDRCKLVVHRNCSCSGALVARFGAVQQKVVHCADTAELGVAAAVAVERRGVDLARHGHKPGWVCSVLCMC